MGLNPQFVSKWKSQVEPVLKKKIKGLDDLRDVIGELSGSDFLNSTHPSNGPTLFHRIFFDTTLPEMRNQALKFLDYFEHYNPLIPDKSLKLEYEEMTVSRESIFSLISCAFFCAFDKLPFPWQTDEDHNNFRQFSFIGLHTSPSGINALKFFVNYFNRFVAKKPKGMIVLRRQCVSIDGHNWQDSKNSITLCEIIPNGKIEDSEAVNHVDFANQFIGGGVLHGGSVQEELLFMMRPECLASMFFCSVMRYNESIIIKGAERFSTVQGYARNYDFGGDFNDTTDIESGVLKRNIIAIDAIELRASVNFQFSKIAFFRDLGKCYAGFLNFDTLSQRPAFGEPNYNKISTGGWGTGVFRGNMELKFLQQLLACSEARREMVYYSFGNSDFTDSAMKFLSEIYIRKVTVGQVIKAYIKGHPDLPSYIGVFDMIISNL